MDSEFQLRIKSSMVVYQLEIELGNFIKSRHTELLADNTSRQIIERLASDSEDAFQQLSLHDLTVENSYLLEALQLCERASENTSDHQNIVILRDLFNRFEIPLIRNSISHPNRPFQESYWYRTAALASDPVIHKLHFTNLLASFQKALEGKIEAPPESWLTAKPSWSVPNNLPEPFDHTVTGLVGRDKDLAQLFKLIKGGRSSLISIVAPGGVGKTSLVLECLYKLCLTPKDRNDVNIDGVIFITLKQDKLTKDGIVLLDTPKSIEELKNSLTSEISEIFGEEFDNFEKQLTSLANKNIYFFIDNLETILRDTPRLFEQFIDELPASWRIIVTSRIAVDGAKNLPLEVLNKPNALQLARQYLLSKGENTKDSNLIDRITEGCKFNPLAIRLCIDSYISGNDITDAILKTNENITDFSFANLLNALSENAQNLLEAIFVLDRPTRTELTEALHIDVDSVSEAIRDLNRTSLIQRHDGELGEQYSLNRAIRDLLKSRPNRLIVRQKINDWLIRSKALALKSIKSQKERGIPQIDQNFVPVNTPARLIEISKSLDSAIRQRKHQEVASIERLMSSLEENYPTSSFLNRLLGRAQYVLGDATNALNSYKLAVEKNPTDPAALYSLGAFHAERNEYAEAEEIGKKLLEMDHIWDPSTIHKKSWVVGLYLRSLAFQEKADEAFSLTNDWGDVDYLMEVKGVTRAHAHKIYAERLIRHESEYQKIGQHWVSAFKILDYLIKALGYNKVIVNLSKKIINDIAFNDGVKKIESKDKDYVCKFINLHYKNFTTYFDPAFEKSIDAIKSSSGLLIDTNVTKETSQESLTLLKQNGYTPVKVTYIPTTTEGFSNFAFAKDNEGNDYFLHVSSFENGNWARWVYLDKDTNLAVKYELTSKGTANRKATEIIWHD